MSALPPEADMLIVSINVCFVPQADIVCWWRDPRGSWWSALMALG